MSRRVHIDTRELIQTEVSEDGESVCLRLLDASGQIVSVSLPACCLNTVMRALPGLPEPAPVRTVDSWHLHQKNDGVAMVLTLSTPEGHTASYAMNTWQIEGIATLARYGYGIPGSSRVVN